MEIFAYRHKEKLIQKQHNEMLAILHEDEKKKVAQFKNQTDAEISLLSRFLLRKILSSVIKVPPAEISFSYNSYNRPALEKVDFNVSHSGDWIVIAVDTKSRVGVDIEKIRKVEPDLMEACFTKEEIAYILKDNIFDLEKFFEIWTLKEAFIKADGKGLSYSLKDFYFSIDNGIQLNYKKKNKDKWFFSCYDLDIEYKLSLCSSTKNIPQQVKIISDLNSYINE